MPIKAVGTGTATQFMSLIEKRSQTTCLHYIACVHRAGNVRNFEKAVGSKWWVKRIDNCNAVVAKKKKRVGCPDKEGDELSMAFVKMPALTGHIESRPVQWETFKTVEGSTVQIGITSQHIQITVSLISRQSMG